MLGPVLVFAGIIWLCLQLRPSRKQVWRDRYVLVHPFVVNAGADLAATWQYFRSFNLRGVLSLSWWRERLEFKRIWRDFHEF